MTISMIGGGNMAVAMLNGMLRQGFASEAFYIVESDVEKRRTLAEKYGVQVAAPTQPLPSSEMVILAVKPQHVAAVLTAFSSQLRQSVLMSIAAGVSIAAIQKLCDAEQRIVRVMPNTPALVQAGISGAIASANVTAEDKQLADRVLHAIGTVIWVSEESALDVITAVSGSGPAYVFYFMQALQEAAQRRGFDVQTARQLAYATFDGAIKLAQSSAEPVSALRAQVTSKRGTTEAAIAAFEQHQLLQVVDQAVQAAVQRAEALGHELMMSLKQ